MGYTLENRTELQDCTHEYIDTGNFSCLDAKFYFRRQIGYHIVQTYIPSVLLVAMSMVIFWIDIHAAIERIGLSFTTVLTITTQSEGIRNGLPKVSYIKAIDVWMAC